MSSLGFLSFVEMVNGSIEYAEGEKFYRHNGLLFMVETEKGTCLHSLELPTIERLSMACSGPDEVLIKGPRGSPKMKLHKLYSDLSSKQKALTLDRTGLIFNLCLLWTKDRCKWESVKSFSLADSEPDHLQANRQSIHEILSRLHYPNGTVQSKRRSVLEQLLLPLSSKRAPVFEPSSSW